MHDEGQRPDTPLLGLYEGHITANDDPRQLGRVRVRVPGYLEPASEWAWPYGMPGAGQKRGLFSVPPVGSEVVVQFLMGDPDRPFWSPGPRTMSGGNGTPDDALDGVLPSDTPKITVFETDLYKLVIDDRPLGSKLKLVHKESGDGFDYDGLTRQLNLKGTVGVNITATGPVTIDGLTVTIAGRLVVPGAGPIR